MAKWVVLAGAFFILLGCKSPNDLDGHYQGTLLQKISGTIEQFPVSADVSALSGNNAQIVLHDASGQVSMTVMVSNIGSNSLTFSITGLGQGPFALVADTHDGVGCYADANEATAFLCAQNNEITIGVNDASHEPIFSLSLDKFNPGPLPTPEAPRSLTLSQTVTTAEQMSFTNKIEFQHVLQARAAEKNAYLNLLPHLTGKTVLSLLLLDTPGFLEDAADVAPFLFPSRWMQAGENAARSDAENDAMILTRADTTLQVQTLVYNLVRNEQVRTAFVSSLATAAQIRATLQTRVNNGDLAASVLDDADSATIFIKQDAEQLDALIEQDKTAIAQTLGFYNPEAITDVSLDTDYPSIASATKLDFDSLNTLVQQQSFELRQIDSLIGGAQLAKKEVPFDWIDPAADPSTSLGFGLGQSIANAQAQIQELLDNRQQIQAIIAQSVQALVDGQATVVDQLADAENNIQIQLRRVATMVHSVSNDTDVDVNASYGILQDQLTALGTLADLQANYRTLQGKLDRLLLRGFYAGLADQPTPNAR